MQFDFKFRSRRSNVMSTRGMVASSHPLASLAGLEMLKSGGNAADAAVATAAALNVVEPIGSGVGGDCFALYWDAKQKTVFALNASGPSAKSSSLQDLLSEGYTQYPLYTGHAVTVPGTVAGWDSLLKRFGRMSFSEILSPAIELAFEGYPVTEWISSGWKLMVDRIQRIEPDRSQPKHKQTNGPPQSNSNEFLVDGRAPEVGEILRLQTLGETLQNISTYGKDYIYEGQFAEKLCNYVQRYDGWLTPDDLSGFKGEWVEPLTANFHGFRLFECPPNSQGLAAIIAAKIADQFPLDQMSRAERDHILIECLRIGFAETLQWVADPKFEKESYQHLLTEGFVQTKREMIKPDRAIDHLVSPYQHTGSDTTYLTVVDQEGNACSFISSLFTGVGTGLIVPGTGVFLQNRAALFDLNPEHPNALEGGKRPYHTIIPALITLDDELFASFGIMGGFMQPQAHLQVLSNLVNLNLNPQQALDIPRFYINIGAGKGVGAQDPGGEVFIEEGFDLDDIAVLNEKGHRISQISGRKRMIFGGGQVIQRNPETGVLIAGSDPRKDGCAIGW